MDYSAIYSKYPTVSDSTKTFYMEKIKTSTDAQRFAKMADNAEEKKMLEEVQLVLKNKPKVWLHKYEINDRGGLKLPYAVSLDADGGTTAVDHLISLLERYKTDEKARPYSKG